MGNVNAKGNLHSHIIVIKVLDEVCIIKAIKTLDE